MLCTRTLFFHMPIDQQNNYGFTLQDKVNNFIRRVEAEGAVDIIPKYLNKEEAYIYYKINL